MTKTELKENITKIEQILKSENYEAGFELLKTINNPELTEALAESIQSTVYDKYFFEGKDEGFEILSTLFPNLTSLDLGGCNFEYVPRGIEKIPNLMPQFHHNSAGIPVPRPARSLEGLMAMI